jgi:hypothetical protein
MFTQKPQKTQGKFVCEKCHFNCSRNVEWNRHISTRKHLNVYECLPENTSDKYFTCECGKIYNYRQSLYVHRKDCKKNISLDNVQISEEKNIVDNKPEKVIIVDSSNNDIIHLLIKENSDFKTMIMDLVKSNTDLQKQMLEVCKNNNSSNTTINNTLNDSSKTFNLQVFLNEKCKDAMNLDDFANSIQLKLSDLIRVGEEGYVPGMSKVIIEWLGGLKVCDRPIHCSDEKREVIQVKVADKWEKEAINSEKLMNAVRIVEKKQFDMITTFRDTYPECMNSESHHNDMLIKLFQNLSNSREPEFIKVMKKVAKSVVINKEENA